jgi:hypothetical protein
MNATKKQNTANRNYAKKPIAPTPMIIPITNKRVHPTGQPCSGGIGFLMVEFQTGG